MLTATKLLHFVDLIDRTRRDGGDIDLQLSSGCFHIAVNANEHRSARCSHSSRKVDQGLVQAGADPAAYHISRDSDDTHHLVALQAGCNLRSGTKRRDRPNASWFGQSLLCRGLTDE